MAKIKKIYIDWTKTAVNLKLLRRDNLNLRRYVCSQLYYGERDCVPECENCKFGMDHSISQSELAKVFNVTESMVVNWENAKSRPQLEDLLYYCKICGVELNDVVVFVD